MIFYYWAIGILCGTFYFSKKSQNYYTFLNITIFVLAVIVMSCNNNTLDEQNVLFNYIHPQEKSISNFLFFVLMDIARWFNLSFSAFNVITNIIALSLIVSTLRLFTNKWGQALSIYLLVASTLDVALFRQFLASSVIVFGLRYILLEKKTIYKYIICVLIASSIHLALIAYLVFIFEVKKTNFFTIKKLVVFCAIALICFITLSNDRVIPGLKLIAGFFNIEKLDSYISISGGRFGWLSMVALYLISLLLCQFICNAYQKKLLYNDKDFLILKKIYSISIISGAFIIPCIMYFSSFSRLFRPLIWVMLIAIIIARKYKPKFIVFPKIFVFELGYLTSFFVLYNVLIFDWNEAIVKIMNATPFWI